MGGKLHQAQRQVAAVLLLTLFFLKGCFEGSNSFLFSPASPLFSLFFFHFYIYLFIFLLYFTFIQAGKVPLIDQDLIHVQQHVSTNRDQWK